MGFVAILESLSPKSMAGRRVKRRSGPFLPGQEKSLINEHQTVLDIVRAMDQNPVAFGKIETILSNMKDPFHAISLLRDERVLTPSELFLVGHLAYTTGKVLLAMAEVPPGQDSKLQSKDISSGSRSTEPSGGDSMDEEAGRKSGVQEVFEPFPMRAVPPSLSDIEKRLLPGSTGQPVFYIADSYSPELAKVRADRKNREKALRAEMAQEVDAVERLLGRKVGLRDEIAIRKFSTDLMDKARLMPELAEVRETVTHVHFRIKSAREAVRLEREINRLRLRESALEGDILAVLSREIAPHAERLEAAAWALGEIDYLICKANLARKWNAVKPEILTDHIHRLGIWDAYHPLIRNEVERRGGAFQPVTIELDESVSVITGPNMGGKTVSLATIGLCVALAQHGFLVPCSRMALTLYDFIYFQPQTPGKPGLSSFAEEIISLKDPLARGAERGLILLDEVGRGTNPSQGLALYAAVLRHLRESHNPMSTVVATTHYHGLAALVGAPHWQVTGLKPERDSGGDAPESETAPGDFGSMPGNGQAAGPGVPPGSGNIEWLYKHMDYRLQKVGPDAPTPQDALLVARLLGLDEDIVRRAERLVKGGKVKIDAETGF